MWTDEYKGEHTKTITHTSTSGVPICTTAPDYSKYKRYLQDHLQLGVDKREMITLLSKCKIKGIDKPKVYNLSINPKKPEEYELLQEEQHKQEMEKILQEEPNTNDEIGRRIKGQISYTYGYHYKGILSPG
jgi:hypothetical protein